MSSSSEFNATRYVESLKDLLKERGITYGELADALHCSLPTVKRALNKPSLPFSRLLEFCEHAQIQFDELHRRAEQRRPVHYVFRGDQDQLFAERKEILQYFLELAKRGLSPSEIAERHDLDRRSSQLYLSHLARVGLVELQGGNRVKLLVEPPFGFGPRSLVMQHEHETFLRNIVSEVLTSDPEDKRRVAVLKPIYLTEEDYDQMIDSLVNVIHRFAAIADRGLSRGDTSLWNVALACGPGLDVQRPPLPRIDR